MLNYPHKQEVYWTWLGLARMNCTMYSNTTIQCTLMMSTLFYVNEHYLLGRQIQHILRFVLHLECTTTCTYPVLIVGQLRCIFNICVGKAFWCIYIYLSPL